VHAASKGSSVMYAKYHCTGRYQDTEDYKLDHFTGTQCMLLAIHCTCFARQKSP